MDEWYISEPGDITDPLVRDLARELDIQARAHGRYFTSLLDAGFDRAEAMQLVRDHHYLFMHRTIAPDAEPAPWMTQRPASSESQPSTAPVSIVSKLTPLEQ